MSDHSSTPKQPGQPDQGFEDTGYDDVSSPDQYDDEMLDALETEEIEEAVISEQNQAPDAAGNADEDVSLPSSAVDDYELDEDEVQWKPKRSKLPMIMGLLVVLAAGGGGYYYYTNHLQPSTGGGTDQPAPPAPTVTESPYPEPEPVEVAEQPLDIPIPVPQPSAPPPIPTQAPDPAPTFEDPLTPFPEDMAAVEEAIQPPVDMLQDPGENVQEEIDPFAQVELPQNPDQAQSAEPVTPPEVEPVEPPVLEPPAPEPVVPPVTEPEDVATPAVNNEELVRLQRQIANMESQVNDTASVQLPQNLAVSIDALRVSVEQMENRFAAIEDRLSAIDSKVAALEEGAQQGNIRPQRVTSSAPPAATTAPRRATPVRRAPPPRWEIRAIQVGRAMVSRVGQNDMRSVSVGDSLPGVGTIRSIDFENGEWVIQGSSGRVSQ